MFPARQGVGGNDLPKCQEVCISHARRARVVFSSARTRMASICPSAGFKSAGSSPQTQQRRSQRKTKMPRPSLPKLTLISSLWRTLPEHWTNACFPTANPGAQSILGRRLSVVGQWVDASLHSRHFKAARIAHASHLSNHHDEYLGRRFLLTLHSCVTRGRM